MSDVEEREDLYRPRPPLSTQAKLEKIREMNDRLKAGEKENEQHAVR
jgi:hypothetical protein